ncbi:unnamed protein product [Staurois parvus]|uniref:Uncharacterized protein n=1 Tax=Staurois parvus TaxID=386267 RepID=A0ABN9G1Q2_9NEOB|nr:unnamed protein product [Staurois parvus]
MQCICRQKIAWYSSFFILCLLVQFAAKFHYKGMYRNFTGTRIMVPL